MVLGIENGSWMRVEAEQGCCGVVSFRNFPKLLQYSAVSCMNTIEGSHGQNRTFFTV